MAAGQKFALVTRTDVDRRTHLARPRNFYLLWINGSLSVEELTKFQETINSFIDAQVTPSWTLIRFDAAPWGGQVKACMPADRKYILQLDEHARTLSCNFNMEPEQAQMMREFLHGAFEKPKLDNNTFESDR